VLVVHDVGYLLRQPYWTDEAWVAVTTRFPLAQLPALTASTPIGWSFLLRLVSTWPGQSGRILPLAFAALTIVPAYVLARRLDWPDTATAIAAGLLAAAAALLVPAMLIRDDLKQYTADACLTLIILAATARLERRWSVGALALLSVATWAGMLLSHTAAFTGAAALGAVCLVQLARRRWRRLTEAAVATAGTAVLGAVVYAAFDARDIVAGLSAYWRAYYVPVPDGLGASVSFVISRFEYVHSRLGLGPPWLAVLLLVIGLVTIGRLGRPATALAAALLWPEMIAVAALGKYPFLDVRTSTFLTTATTVVAAIGVAGCCAAVRSWLRGGRLATAAAGLMGAAALAAFVVQAVPFARGQPIPAVSIRQQAQFLAVHAGRADPIVVAETASWGFAYYWPAGSPERAADAANLQGYVPVFPDQRRIIVVRDRTTPAVRAALATALTRIAPGACGEIWLVRPRFRPAEAAMWRTALASLNLSPQASRFGLAVAAAGPRSCRATAGPVRR
jgi:hypothetical protein